VPITADNLPDDLAALKRIISAMAQDALTAQAEIARLKFQLARYRRAEFGRSSEKLAREAEQLELALEALETDQAERLATASPEVAAAAETLASGECRGWDGQAAAGWGSDCFQCQGNSSCSLAAG
jgi:transposase